MTGYCKRCQCSHSAWTRLNNGVICGRCGSRERDLRLRPIVPPRLENPRSGLHIRRQG